MEDKVYCVNCAWCNEEDLERAISHYNHNYGQSIPYYHTCNKTFRYEHVRKTPRVLFPEDIKVWRESYVDPLVANRDNNCEWYEPMPSLVKTFWQKIKDIFKGE